MKKIRLLHQALDLLVKCESILYEGAYVTGRSGIGSPVRIGTSIFYRYDLIAIIFRWMKAFETNLHVIIIESL